MHAVAKSFEQDDAGGDGNVEGANGAGGGNGNEEVAALADEIVQPRTFASHDDADAAFVIHFGVAFFRAFVEANQPKASFLELLHGTRQIFDARDRQMRERAGGDARYRVR